MAEERTLGLARAASDSAESNEPDKEELQRRMEQARESITQTVTEIKETVTNQYYSVKESVSDALDWRHHFRKSPIAFSVGALSVGFLVGYGVAGALKGRGNGRGDYPTSEESNVYARTGAQPLKIEDDEAIRHTAFHGHSYAAQPITDSLSTSAAEDERRSSDEEASDYSSTRGGGSYSYSAPTEEEEPEDKKPGLLERFKETSAYDRLQAEVASLGDRFIEELSKTAQNVVLPALFNKIKELFGVDLSNKQSQGQQTQSSSSQTKQAGGGAPQTTNTQAKSASASSASASRGQSYATSENRGYGSQSSERATNSGSNDSVLDLDR